MNIQLIQEILVRAQEIHKKHESLANINGDNFNVFSILGMENCENKTHSNFLRELLDPRGSHGLKSAFLKLFVSQVWDIIKQGKPHHEYSNISNIDDKTWEHAVVEVEKHIGTISQCGESGGRIDILISIENKPIIIIENKIYAGDQEKQLVRYKSFAEKFGAILLYLNLYGDSASESSTGNGSVACNSDYFTISYQHHIFSWLDACARASFRNPLVRETINQYINLIKKITKQTTLSSMNNEIVGNLILESENKFEASWMIYQEFKRMQDERINELKRFMSTVKAVYIPVDDDKKIKCGIGLDGGIPYICFDIWFRDERIKRDSLDFRNYLGFLDGVGFTPTSGNYWKFFSYSYDNNISRKYEYFSKNIEEAENEIICERDSYIEYLCDKNNLKNPMRM